MSGTGDFWEDSQAFLGVPDTDVRDLLAQLDGSTPAAVELLTGASREELDALGGFTKRTCPKCGGHVRRWYADADGDGDVDPRAQCDDCEWGY